MREMHFDLVVENAPFAVPFEAQGKQEWKERWGKAVAGSDRERRTSRAGEDA